MMVNILIVFVSILAATLLWAIVKIIKITNWINGFIQEVQEKQARYELREALKELYKEIKRSEEEE